jgi:hypothetical protein
MGIRFHFDRDKLSPREAQLVSALIAVLWDSRTSILRSLYKTSKRSDAEKRAGLEKQAENVRILLSRDLPDLTIRWEWCEPADPEPGEPEPE